MSENSIKYFLAANSCEGFVSYFENVYNAKDGWQVFIIKGGPGTGKSSFMRAVANLGQERGYTCDYGLCSSDPDSLDAVIFPEMKVAIMDGTAPHTLDPKYAGVSETILNFGEFWEDDALQEKRQEIIAVTDKNKALHKTAARYLKSAGWIINDNLSKAAAVTDKTKTERIAEALSKKYLKPQNKKPKETVCFLSGITPKGVIHNTDIIQNNFENLVIIKDDYGYVADLILSKLREKALKFGYKTVTVKNVFLPKLIDCLLLPELSLGFVRESEQQIINRNERRIHARRFMDVKSFNMSKEKLKFNKKAARELINSAVDTLYQAKQTHDELENYYIKAMDFDALNKFTSDFAEKLFR